MEALIPLISNALQPLLMQPAKRDVGGSQTTTLVVTATAPAPTVTATSTSTQIPQQPVSNASSGPKSSPILFIALVTILGTALLILIGTVVYSCITRKRRHAREAASASAAVGNELQPTPTAQPAVQSEVHGFYAPAGTGVVSIAKTEEEVAARELYGYFAPSVAPRIGDGVVARPGVGGREFGFGGGGDL
ncbi:hypothetical protein L207DRAFT_506108 [Hyaloscypha variabilis F]|uniref:Transmembrane protein n=1 Tax=Hyaloscypha variabilis (strain UAMH 11265 / GT02V1 / F) TaxID=1149755 RepID=A0A2J6S8F4_HYAVF|nr:hypothetical protein L207DRAFT_506108 [Hyaloscypha variabilis F]